MTTPRRPSDPEPEHPDRIRDNERPERPEQLPSDRPERHPRPEQLPSDDPRRPGAHPDNPLPAEKPKPKREAKTEASDPVRVILTGDDRHVYTEAYVPAADYGFRISIEGQHFEQIGESVESGARVFAPTR